jgi:hypothetical protein
MTYNKDRTSPIKDDSVILRSHGDEFLSSFAKKPSEMTERGKSRSSLAKEKPEMGEMILKELNYSHLTPTRP